MSNKIVKEIIQAIVGPLVYLLNIMLGQGVYPRSLNITNIIPVHKKGDKLVPSSHYL